MSFNEKYPTLAVLTNYGPHDNSAGSLNLRMLLKGYTEGKVCWFNTKQGIRQTLRGQVSWDFLDEKSSDRLHLNSLVNAILWRVDRIVLRRFWISSNGRKWLRRVSAFLLWHVWAKLEAVWAQRFCRVNKIEICFIALDWPFVPFAWRFVKQANIPVHVRVDDDPQASIEILGKPINIAYQVDHAFADCYRLAQSREVVSEGMRLHYKKRFDIDAVVRFPLNNVPAKEVSGSRGADRSNKFKGLRLIHLGHLRKPEQRNLEALLSALSILNKEKSADCTIDFFGRALKRYEGIKMPHFATVHGWVPLSVLENHLGSCDFSYVAQSFYEAHRTFVETSFPSKIGSSVKRRLPIIYHGPLHSSAAKFLEEYKAGIVLDTLNVREITAQLIEISKSDREKMEMGCLRAATEQFDQRVTAENWRSTIAQTKRQQENS